MWDVEKVAVSPHIRRFELYSAKDKEMAKQADYGFMIWNVKSMGTLNNIVNSVNDNKRVIVYFIPNIKFYTLRSQDDLKKC